jgi:two-component system chemotaxis sensor kinase CheA
MDPRKYLELFLTEAREHQEQIARGARELSASSPAETIHALFRSFHSIKGMAASMEYNALAELAHGVEDLFDAVRQGKRGVDRGLSELTLEAADRIGALLDEIAAGRPAATSTEDLMQRVRAALAGGPGPASPAESAPAAAVTEGSASADPGAPADAAVPGPTLEVTFEVGAGAPLPAARALVALKRLQTLGAVLRCDPEAARWTEKGFKGQVRVEMRSATEPAAIAREIAALPDIAGCRARPTDSAADGGPAAPRPVSNTVRVRTEILDRLMDGVGELLVAAGALEGRLPKAPGNDAAAQRLHRGIHRMHDDILEMRMVPFDWVAQRFYQSVRNLAHNLGKEVELEIRGADVRMDRAMLEDLVDPINHMLRNSIDHGIEPPAQRATLGKPPCGRISLALERESEVVRILLSDDGRGMDPARIRDAAVRKGFITAEHARSLGEAEVLMLTTIPGFSTADKLTEVSGRGVGMDVVRTRIESLGGHMHIFSRPGRGTEIDMSLPLTVAVIDSLLLRLGPDLYAVPIHSVKQTLEVRPEQVQYSGGGALVQWGEHTVHLRALRELLGEGDAGGWSRGCPAVVFETGGRVYGLGVDSVVGKRPIVVKPLKSPLENLREYSGATVLENGRIALLLDLVNLARG